MKVVHSGSPPNPETGRPGDWHILFPGNILLRSLLFNIFFLMPQDPIAVFGPRSYFKRVVTKHCQSNWHCVDICKSTLSFPKRELTGIEKTGWQWSEYCPWCICESLIALVMSAFIADML